MLRALLTAALLALALAPAAGAQEPEPTPPPGCERGPGTDADYAYCPDDECREDGTDADYVYACPGYAVPASGGGGEPASDPRAAAARPLAAQTLPMTGGEALIVAAAGFGLLLAGAGLRLRYL